MIRLKRLANTSCPCLMIGLFGAQTYEKIIDMRKENQRIFV